ncbi:MAG TPA: hypothetical protein PLE45_02125 [Spirochaetota bacterium]|nr:hypothetical protein [Spirochaetota bacterium]HPP04430.1 hypothetical protein [Spirochaetota bacterium]
MEEILKKIVDKRVKDIKDKGYNQGFYLPEKREVPLNIPNLDKEIIICEIKRGSPSEGKMNDIVNPVDWANCYIESGANVISVLTEENFFYGNLKDLIEIKKSIKECSVLRKDFLLYEEDIRISYRAGADLVLLIVSILNYEKLKRLKELAEDLGMLPLIEVHNLEELEIALKLNPKLIGINSRDLKTFNIDRNYPIGLKSLIPENIKVIFESGIRNYTDAFFIGNSGFNGILVGTRVVKSDNIKEKIEEIKNGFINGYKNKNNFYQKIFKKIYFDKKIVVKICGITNIDDAIFIRDNKVDIIGFIFAKSPREISIEKAKEISSILKDSVLKVGVVVDKNIDQVVNLVREGYLDAIQFHNDMNNDQCMSYNVCWYKAIRVKEKEDFLKEFYSPIVLYDAFSKESYGGTGRTIDSKLLDFAKEKDIRLYLAGGINEYNIEEIIKNWQPLLIDVSSGVEESPGKKSKEKIYLFLKKIKKIKN